MLLQLLLLLLQGWQALLRLQQQGLRGVWVLQGLLLLLVRWLLWWCWPVLLKL